MTGSASYLTYAELRDALGDDAASKVVAARGGQRFYVRETIDKDHPLATALGLDLARKLASHIATGIGGMNVELPTGRGVRRPDYWDRLRALAADPCMTEAGIARELGVHARTVRRMRARLRQEGSWPVPAPEPGQLSGA